VLSTVRDDRVLETSAGLYVQNTTQWLEKFRTVAGVRGDLFYADVTSDTALNSGTALAFQPSPKLSLIFGPWADTELFANAGRGFHSNDARGATIRVDPRDPTSPQSRVPLLVSAVGEEVGVRTTVVPGLQSSLALFRLDFDSELVFSGDAGTTEASRPSRRVGIELTNRYQATPWLALDADIAVSRARFTDSDPAGSHIPGSVGTVVSAGATIDQLGPWYGALRFRYFGPRALIEDNSVQSNATPLVDLRTGVKLTEQTRVQVEIFNLLNTKASQIDYFYTSRLLGEPAAGVSDIHFHPVEPIAARLTISLTF
jgi:outer membrane receptor protein involved in Fe transport